MRANRAYRLIHTRGRRGPSFFSGPGRVDQVEVVSVDDGEIVLFWDVPGAAVSRFLRALRADLAQLEADEFAARWAAIEDPSEL